MGDHDRSFNRRSDNLTEMSSVTELQSLNSISTLEVNCLNERKKERSRGRNENCFVIVVSRIVNHDSLSYNLVFQTLTESLKFRLSILVHLFRNVARISPVIASDSEDKSEISFQIHLIKTFYASIQTQIARLLVQLKNTSVR
jgi:hypothetical protein